MPEKHRPGQLPGLCFSVFLLADSVRKFFLLYEYTNDKQQIRSAPIQKNQMKTLKKTGPYTKGIGSGCACNANR